MARIIGIDLGTTYSAVSIYEARGDDGPGVAKVITNLRGKDTTPSVVSLNRAKEVIVGWAAKNNLEYDPDNTLVEVKRLMGEPPEVVAEKTEGRGIKLDGKDYMPQQISAFILRDLKAAAEKYLGEEVFDAVVTCPAYFGETQKRATREAGLLAGLNVHRVLAEPVAAAIAYGVEKATDEFQTFVVYDLGGGTFDVSVINVDSEDIEVIGTAGDANLGGGDFDNLIVDWVVDEIKKRHDVDLSKDMAAKARIKSKAEEAKIQLSVAQSADMHLPFITMTPRGPLGDTFTLKRAKFEMMVMPLLKRTVASVKEAIAQAKVKDSEVDEASITALLLVGGSSRMPRVKAVLDRAFPDIEVRGDLNPDLIVAQGAALVASNLRAVGKPPSLDGDPEPEAPIEDEGDEPTGLEFNIRNVVSHSLGIAVGRERRFDALIKKNSDIPCTVSKAGFTTGTPNQPKVMVEVYEGEAESVEAPEMSRIGEFEVTGWEPGPVGCVEFKFDFSVDMNGILSVTATELRNGIQVDQAFTPKDMVQQKTMAELQQELGEVNQSGVAEEGKASAAPAEAEAILSAPSGLPEDYEGYWAEAASKLAEVQGEGAEKLRGCMKQLAAAVETGGDVEAAAEELIDALFDV